MIRGSRREQLAGVQRGTKRREREAAGCLRGQTLLSAQRWQAGQVGWSRQDGRLGKFRERINCHSWRPVSVGGQRLRSSCVRMSALWLSFQPRKRFSFQVNALYPTAVPPDFLLAERRFVQLAEVQYLVENCHLTPPYASRSFGRRMFCTLRLSRERRTSL